MGGTCTSCDMIVNGDRVPACQAKVPDWDVVIEHGVPRKELNALERQSQPSSREPKQRAGGGSPFANPFGSNPFGGGPPDPFGGEPEGRVVPTQQQSAEPKKLSLQERLAAEEAAKRAAKKKGGWPFG